MFRRARASALSLTAISATVLLAACTADPPPPVESTETTTSTTPVSPAVKLPVVVAIDEIGAGFNPHLRTDQSPANAAVSSLVLPSPFRPVPSADRPGQTDWVPDPALTVSADMTSQDPPVITYQLRNEAQWSDGAPIAAEDFRYLWQQMISEPGVVDPAGYQLIEDVTSSGGGKTVTVTLRDQYPAWRELFTDLLPAHLIKDSPGGFTSGLAENLPVSGGQFHIKSIDRGRDEILLERNDRFWGTPATPDQILMRRGGSTSQLADSMRTGDTQIAEVHGGSAAMAQLEAIPGLRTDSIFQPRSLDLTLNSRVPALADVEVRRGLLDLLDPVLLATVGAGSDSAVAVAGSLVRPPSDPQYVATAPARPVRDLALDRLGRAGFVPDPENEELLTRDGEVLALTIGVPENDPTAAAVANTAADQLRGAGVDATVEAVPADEIYGEALISGEVGAVVGWTRAGSDPATAVVSRYGCPPDPSVELPPGAPDAEARAEAPTNHSGVCDPALQPEIDAALRGAGEVDETLADVDHRLWDLAAVLPIMQDRTMIAAGPGVEGVSLGGPLPVGVFADAAGWSRLGR